PAASGRGVRFLGADQALSAFSGGRLRCFSCLSWLSQEMAVRDRHSSRIWPGCSLSGCGPKPVRFFCRSSEMLLAALVAITRNGCARSAFQPPLAGGVGLWVLTDSCTPVRKSVVNAARVSRGYHKKWLCAIGIPAASGRGVRFLGADQNLSAFCQAEAFYRSMNSSPDQSDLFPGFVPAPQMVFVNDRVSFQTEAK